MMLERQARKFGDGPDDLFLRVLCWVAVVLGLTVVSAVFGGCASAPPPVPTPDRVVYRDVPVRCDVPKPRLRPMPVARDDGQRVSFSAPEAHQVADNFEELLRFLRDYLARCAK